MAHGGARPGAGRRKGSANIINAEARKKALQNGETPLEYLLGVMRNPKTSAARRLDAAKAAAPYVHARLSAMTMKNDGDEPFKVELSDARSSLAEKIARLSDG